MNRYEQLFGRYVTDLDAAHRSAAAWWAALVSSAGESQASARWPLGPTGHPLVLAVYRQYYLACEQLNEEVRAAEAKQRQDAEQGRSAWGEDDVPAAAGVSTDADGWGDEWPMDPPVFLVDTLFGRRDDLGEFMTRLVFSPMGELDGRTV